MISRLSGGSIDGVLEEGILYSVGGKEIELDRQITKSDFATGRCFGNGLGALISTPSVSAAAPISTARTKSNFVSPSIRKPPPPLVEKRGIPLQPVDLASNNHTEFRNKNEQVPVKASLPTYWTANWSITLLNVEAY
jgi:DNA repair and recombination protein RAD54B